MLQVVLIAVILGMVVYGDLKVKALVRWRALVRSGLAMACYPDDYRGDNPVLLLYRLCGISNLSEETKDAERVIPRAIS